MLDCFQIIFRDFIQKWRRSIAGVLLCHYSAYSSIVISRWEVKYCGGASLVYCGNMIFTRTTLKKRKISSAFSKLWKRMGISTLCISYEAQYLCNLWGPGANVSVVWITLLQRRIYLTAKCQAMLLLLT